MTIPDLSKGLFVRVLESVVVIGTGTVARNSATAALPDIEAVLIESAGWLDAPPPTAPVGR